MDKLLAIILDKFKAANPIIWAIIAAFLSVVQYAIAQGSAFGLFQVEGITADILQWVSWALALLIGSRTTNIVKPELQNAMIVAQAEAETHQANYEDLSKDYNTLLIYRNELEQNHNDLIAQHQELIAMHHKVLADKQADEKRVEDAIANFDSKDSIVSYTETKPVKKPKK